jgi:cytochrome c556
MRVHSAGAALMLTLALMGCGSSQLGPAKPEDTPVVKQEEVRDQIMKSMPPEMMQRYGDKMKKGGS